jgi:hypothetical protein
MGELGDHTDVQQRTSYKTYKRGSKRGYPKRVN